jgi:putative ABC transport system substrate-binding protein
MIKDPGHPVASLVCPFFGIVMASSRLQENHAKAKISTSLWSSFRGLGQDLYRRAANYVDKIFRGAKPVDLPVEQPTTFELVVNLKTAKTLRTTMPPSLLLRADQVLE